MRDTAILSVMPTHSVCSVSVKCTTPCHQLVVQIIKSKYKLIIVYLFLSHYYIHQCHLFKQMLSYPLIVCIVSEFIGNVLDEKKDAFYNHCYSLYDNYIWYHILSSLYTICCIIWFYYFILSDVSQIRQHLIKVEIKR